jgi:hypothetical protein
MSTNTTYTYTKLDRERLEMILLTLLPCSVLDDPVQIAISHVLLIIKEKGAPVRPDIEGTRMSLQVNGMCARIWKTVSCSAARIGRQASEEHIKITLAQ